jgi:predicted amidohydrolase
MPIKVAVVQAPPILLDRTATIALMLQYMAEVAEAGAKLIVFPEAYIPGYPTGFGDSNRAPTWHSPMKFMRGCASKLSISHAAT